MFNQGKHQDGPAGMIFAARPAELELDYSRAKAPERKGPHERPRDKMTMRLSAGRILVRQQAFHPVPVTEISTPTHAGKELAGF